VNRLKRSRLFIGALALALTIGIVPAGTQVQAEPAVTYPAFADPAFQTVWERYDKPVYYGQASRSYTWGNQITAGLSEGYAEGPNGKHLVQYFDKSRMEINNPDGDRSADFFVTQGLLARDMIRGEIQEGDNQFRKTSPAEIPFGDLDDTGGASPTYASFAKVLNDPPIPAGNAIKQRLDRDGSVNNSADARGVTSMGVIAGVTTNHSIASVFYQFLQSTGPVTDATGGYTTAPIYNPTFYVTGLPITEAYWATVKAAGGTREVLIQCFERRCLTYTPSNPTAFQVELANTGLQYYAWRYPQNADKIAPKITELVVTDVTTTSVRIVWKTDEAATSEVKFGTTDQYDHLAGNLELAKFHSVTLEELLPNQNYHFIVISRDVVGNVAQTADAGFKTRAVGEVIPPTATPTATPVATATATPTAVPTATPSPSPSASPSASPSPSPSASPSPSPSPSPSASPSPSPSASPSPSPSPSESPSPSPSVSPAP
jgi:hypothetical protein